MAAGGFQFLLDPPVFSFLCSLFGLPGTNNAMTFTPCVSLWCIGLLVWAFQASIRAQSLTAEEIYQTVLPSVMTLEVETREGEKCLGTAFLAVGEGMAVTAWHLVRDARKVSARFADLEVREVTGVLDWDEVKDIALVQMRSFGRPMSRLCVADPKVGERAYAIGAPKGYEFSISDGLVSQLRVIDHFTQCQISCPISSGNSGGPVLNARGEVLGIVTWSQKDAQNLNFATPSRCLQNLQTNASPTFWAGLSKERRARQRRPADSRQWERIEPKCTHDQMGELRALLERAAGERVSVTICRESESRTFQVTLPPGLLK